MKKREITLIITIITSLSIIALLMPWICSVAVGTLTGIEIITATGKIESTLFFRVLLTLFAIVNAFLPFTFIIFRNKKVVAIQMRLPFILLVVTSIYILQISSNSNNLYINNEPNVFINFFSNMQYGFWFAFINSIILLRFAAKQLSSSSQG